MSPIGHRSFRRFAALTVICLAAMSGCGTAAIRVQNISTLDFTDVTIPGRPYGDIAAGATSDYGDVELVFS